MKRGQVVYVVSYQTGPLAGMLKAGKIRQSTFEWFIGNARADPVSSKNEGDKTMQVLKRKMYQMKPDLLRAERKRRGWSQAEAAEALGIATKTVIRWELGQ